MKTIKQHIMDSLLSPEDKDDLISTAERGDTFHSLDSEVSDLYNALGCGPIWDLTKKGSDYYKHKRDNWQQYVIKPEPEYIPYETVDEAQHLLGEKIKAKDGNCIMIITSIGISEMRTYTDLGNLIVSERLEFNHLSAEHIFDFFTLMDGSPIGKIKN